MQQILTFLRSQSRRLYNSRTSRLNSRLHTAPRLSTTSRHYSNNGPSSPNEGTKRSGGAKSEKTATSSSSNTTTNPGQLPPFSLTGLGASPTVKFVVYTMLGIMGTVETYAYGKWAWYKWGPKEPISSDDEVQVTTQEGT